jgi:hypothetical protein
MQALHGHLSLFATVKTGLDNAADYVETAKELLDKAHELCRQLFQNAEILRSAIEESRNLLERVV